MAQLGAIILLLLFVLLGGTCSSSSPAEGKVVSYICVAM